MHDSWVAYFRTQLATQRHANIRENKGPSFGKKSSQSSSSAQSVRFFEFRRRLKDRRDVPAETRGDWPRISKSSKKRTKLLFFSPTEVWCVPAPFVIKQEERTFCCRIRREHAHVEQERLELCRIGNREGL